MFRVFFNNFFEQKFYLMFITAVIYILGLIAFFNNCPVILFGSVIFILIAFLLRDYISPKLAIFWTFVFLFAFFNAFYRIKASDDLVLIAPQNAVIKGQVVTIPDMGFENRTRFFFNVSEINFNNKTEKINAKTFVTLDGKPDINVGDFYELKGKLRLPFKVSNPSQFDYAKYLRNFNTHTTFFADKNYKINQELTLKWKFLQKLNNMRKDILSYHAKNIKSPYIEILGGIVFGDDAVSPPDNIKKSFINAGILHILAASGMNVALIYGIFFYILNKIKIPYKLNVSIGIATVILYTLMTGMGASVIRAAVILIFILVGKLIDRDAHSISLLSFVAILMLVCNPAYINDVGFQLSFIVTFGLLVMSKPLLDVFNFLSNWLSSTIFIPIIAQLWVAPIQMFYFNSFCVYSIFANILILPFVTIISFGGFISSVLALIKPLANPICYVFDLVLNPTLIILVCISDFFSNLSNSLVTMPKPTILQIVLYYIGLGLFTVIIKNGFSKKIIAGLVSVFVLMSLSFINFDRASEIIFFDVQNADCILYKTPKNKYFIIDTGKLGYKGGKNQVNYILMEYLKDEGIKNIEALILTHFDSDHAGGASDLIENLKIKTVYVNSLNDESNIAKKIYKLHNNVKKVENNSVIYSEDNIKIKTYIANLTGEENENSVITLIDDKGYKSLFMGDAGVTAFEKTEKDLPQKIDVFKVGHHGAKNVINEEMIKKLSPKYSVISTGINKFGHPNQLTVDMLENNSKVFRTDRNNAIKIRNKHVYVYNPQKGFELYD